MSTKTQTKTETHRWREPASQCRLFVQPPLLYQILPRVGQEIAPTHGLYPRFHDDHGNAGFRVVHSVEVDYGHVQVVADDDTQEWIWFREDGSALYTRVGWGSMGYALHDALNHAYAKGGA